MRAPSTSGFFLFTLGSPSFSSPQITIIFFLFRVANTTTERAMGHLLPQNCGRYQAIV